MLAHEIRQKYLDFFSERDHLHLSTAPLVPIDALGNEDKTTLFTGSGMQQFKPYFANTATPPHGRVVTIQKCVRTGDIDSVGDLSHCTFFEMLGNFSFGDYFKAEVIPWTWEFLTKVVGLDPDKFCVTVFHEDDEAFEIWHKVVGLPVDRIHRMQADKNFWPANAIEDGPDGPCGPCSEVFYRVVPIEEMTTDPTLTATERYKIDDDAGRWLEVWNNVFTQFDRSLGTDANPVLTPLPKKNNDTGAGFDRIVQVHQNKKSVFETDLFAPILARIAEISGTPYTGTLNETDFALRVVAEHTRTMVFCIADGILPSNEGRGYVLRYIMRRAMRFGKMRLGMSEPFLYRIAPMVIEQMGDFYTEIRERQELILQTIQGEEERFLRTLENGIHKLNEFLDRADAYSLPQLSGAEAFMLYDTYGFPLELTRDMAKERGLNIDEAGFEEAKAEQQQRSREAGAPKEVWATGDNLLNTLQSIAKPTRFLGYSEMESHVKVRAILHNGVSIDTAKPGDTVEVVLDESPFYAESGGQVGDTGSLVGEGSGVECAPKLKVLDTQKTAGFWIHKALVLEGELKNGAWLNATVDAGRRLQVQRNHTTTHLLQAALRIVLGGHVHQKGSLVSPDVLRFDFTHTGPMSHEEIQRVEDIVNEHILMDQPVGIFTDIPIAEAKERGAMALFGEKYGDSVRMVEIPGFSLELCGGIHLQRTSQAGLFRIKSETGIGAGVRRIEAVTGQAAVAYVKELEAKLRDIATQLKTNTRDVLAAVEKSVKERTELQQQVQKLKSGAVSTGADMQESKIGDVLFVTSTMVDADGETLAAVADRTAQSKGSAVVALGSQTDGKALFVVKVTPDLVKRGLHAGNLVREMAKIAGGGGGGRPDFAQAGGKDGSRVTEALQAAAELVRQTVSS
ncbi:MAG: alanine--tRNA ligase [Chthonomonadales bacterium]